MDDKYIISEAIDNMVDAEVQKTYEEHGGELTEEEFKDMLRKIIKNAREM